MRRIGLTLGALACAAATAFALAQGSGQDTLQQYSATLNKAQTLTVDFTAVKSGEAGSTYTVSLAKPNLARIDTSAKLVVADGKTITTYDKGQNTYISAPETDASLRDLLKADGLNLFAPFFDASAINDPNADDKGAASAGDVQTERVEFALPGKNRVATVFIGKDDMLLHKAQIKSTSIDQSGGQSDHTTTLVATSISVSGAAADPGLYAFKAPDGAKEMTLADLNTAKWYTDLDEAKAVAAKTNRKIFVDFMASWCGPCHMLDDEVFQKDDFKKLSKYFVFLRIDVDQQPSVSAAYSVTAMPTQLVLDAQGNVLDTTVGYGGSDAFYQFINKDIPAGG